MSAFLQQIFELITTNPGNLAYHLVLAFSVAGALQASFSQLNSRHASHYRLVAGLVLLLVLRLVLFLAAALAWQGFLISPQHLPPLDRLVNLLSLVLIIWLWAFPEPLTLADAAAVLLSLLVLTLFGIALVWWNQFGQPLDYNGTWLDIYGETFAILLLALGLAVLLVRRPNSWGIGLGMFSLLLLGHFSHWLNPLPAGDFAGAVRLTQMAAFTLLFTLPQRFTAPITAASISTALSTPILPEPERRPHLQYCLSFLDRAVSQDRTERLVEAARLVSYLTNANACLLVALSDQPDLLNLRTGFILFRQEEIDEAALTGPLVKTIGSAIKRGRSFRLSQAATASGSSTFESILQPNQIGPLLAVPFQPDGPSFPLALLLIAHPTQPEWTEADQSELSSLSETLARVIHTLSQVADENDELVRLREYLHSIQHEIAELRTEKEALSNRLKSAHQEAAREKERSASLAALVPGYEAAQEKVARLEAELVELRKTPAVPSASSEAASSTAADLDHMEKELRLALQEIAHLKKDLSEADQKLLQLKAAPSQKQVTGEELSDVAAISQELRQPMSSIIGYTDLLLSESVGILGAMQRKFLERIKAANERMSTLVEDMIQISLRKTSGPGLVQQTVDLNMVIDEAMTLSLSQLREKNITLRVDIPNQLPPILADRDAMQQIIIHLLQNASSATPDEGEIYLHAHVRDESGRKDYVLLQVADSGGGIPTSELPRLFSRLYRAEHPAIPGVGDPGIGLSIVKSLVEALGGRIWVDTIPDKGSTFSVLLPILANSNGSDGSGVRTA
jgi:signal transduction histidine kinase